MSRQRADVHESSLGPLFSPPIGRLVGRDDPATSRKAAGEVLASGSAEGDAAYLRNLVYEFPGATMEELGAAAARERGGDPYRWRLKLGRRTGTLQDAGAIHVDGERGGMARWWPGPLGGAPSTL